MALHLLEALRDSLDSWFEQQKSQLAEDPLEPLPRERSLAVQRQVAGLNIPAAQLTFVRQELEEAIAAWRSDPDASHVLILLSRPVDPIAPVIEAALAGWTAPVDVCHTLLPCHHRPADPQATALMLSAALEEPLPSGAGDDDTVLLCLPSLDQCFLRCIKGWSGIGHLREVILERRDRFWLLGCNGWAWKFLDHVSQINSYFPDARTLPALTGDDLRDWLAPVSHDLGLGRAADDQPNDAGDGEHSKTGAGETDQWAQLADLSLGSFRIAAELWLGALRLDPDSEAGRLQQSRPALPTLPALTDEDRYILHSLLIHGALRRDHLAYGLGLPSHRLQPRIQRLLGEGLLRQSAAELCVQPGHYPALVKELANSNLFTGEA
ncbi:hypothetical protein KQ304_08835 [Synechococcus sp. CS-1329]|uniref:hypothetical protein n=1 Tax=Synechococcus sp. CS-1329 TaxID=2847975 RepID=UPI00223A8A8E|nr:hypothetical protein [Synechococcus sp. CS-1329]MCT0219101.1 hypothetical protein [Synechococcus sp. CS-1329]